MDEHTVQLTISRAMIVTALEVWLPSQDTVYGCNNNSGVVASPTNSSRIKPASKPSLLVVPPMYNFHALSLGINFSIGSSLALEDSVIIYEMTYVPNSTTHKTSLLVAHGLFNACSIGPSFTTLILWHTVRVSFFFEMTRVGNFPTSSFILRSALSALFVHLSVPSFLYPLGVSQKGSYNFADFSRNHLRSASLRHRFRILFWEGLSIIDLIFFGLSMIPLVVTMYPKNLLPSIPSMHLLGFSFMLTYLERI
uniref:Uncharacterized protein n=1 Tax=Tanacetum cinerariifolium TaxID=118510 RepID=A0A6L2KXH8_TANCI|nr:hypothetical protein [Tanacetum cinerariifolium]